MPDTLYLGLDVQADVSSFCLLNDDRYDKPQQGRVTLDGFPKLLEDAKPQFLACEFTDRQDAKTIAQVFRRWANHDSEYTMNPHLFLDSDMVEEAWNLRAMLFELKKLRQYKTSAQLKVQIAAKTLLPNVTERWMEIAANLCPVLPVLLQIHRQNVQAFTRSVRLRGWNWPIQGQ